jgi:mono/diheme cytochrome c family protein
MSALVKLIVPIAAIAVAAPSMAFADAKQDYMDKCAVCHGADGQGKGVFAEYLRNGAPNLAGLSANNKGIFPKEKTIAIIKGEVKGHGTREMPLWGKAMSDAEINAMVGYLASIQAK